MGQRPLLCPLHGARCDATPARTCITMSRYEAQYGTGGLIPASTLTLIIPESSSDLYEDLLSLPPSVPSGLRPPTSRFVFRDLDLSIIESNNRPGTRRTFQMSERCGASRDDDGGGVLR